MKATKKCAECGRELPTSEFNKNKNTKDGLQDRCRECFSKYNKARYAAKVVRTVRECAVCGRQFEVSGKSRKLTCSDECAKVRKRERELAWKAATRNGCAL